MQSFHIISQVIRNNDSAEMLKRLLVSAFRYLAPLADDSLDMNT
jgi:hypothetical protein